MAALAKGRGVVLAGALVSTLAAGADGPASPPPETVVVENGPLRLRAQLWRPRGNGPFPAALFNHGSGRSTESDQATFLQQAAVLGPVFARHGYVFLFLYRRGAGLSAGQGVIDGDLLEREHEAHGEEARNRMYMQLLETDELGDALAGLAFLRSLPDVDGRRLVAVGHSFGGSLTLLLGERESDLRAVIDFAGAAGSWARSPDLRARLLAAVRRSTVPVFIIHAANDYSVAPAEPLAAELARLGKSHRMKIYPPVGRTTREGHNFVQLGVAAWEPEVFAFLEQFVRPETPASMK